MEIKRLALQIAVCFIPKYKKRAEFLKKHHVFHECGENVRIQSRKIPLYANLIAFHNNISIASNVSFLTHDVMHTVFRTMTGETEAFQEHIGCIEIFDNVFIGSNSTIMSGVKIGPNAIVAGGAVVTKNVPPGSVVGGGASKGNWLFRRNRKTPQRADLPQRYCTKETALLSGVGTVYVG